jgi:hypothetical protein
LEWGEPFAPSLALRGASRRKQQALPPQSPPPFLFAPSSASARLEGRSIFAIIRLSVKPEPLSSLIFPFLLKKLLFRNEKMSKAHF